MPPTNLSPEYPEDDEPVGPVPEQEQPPENTDQDANGGTIYLSDDERYYHHLAAALDAALNL